MLNRSTNIFCFLCLLCVVVLSADDSISKPISIDQQARILVKQAGCFNELEELSYAFSDIDNKYKDFVVYQLVVKKGYLYQKRYAAKVLHNSTKAIDEKKSMEPFLGLSCFTMLPNRKVPFQFKLEDLLLEGNDVNFQYKKNPFSTKVSYFVWKEQVQEDYQRAFLDEFFKMYQRQPIGYTLGAEAEFKVFSKNIFFKNGDKRTFKFKKTENVVVSFCELGVDDMYSKLLPLEKLKDNIRVYKLTFYSAVFDNEGKLVCWLPEIVEHKLLSEETEASK